MGLGRETSFLLVFLVLLAFKLWWDKRAKDKGRVINHFRSALIDGVIYAGTGYLLFGFEFYKWLILAVGLRWLLFDLFFNFINDWEWNYYGSSSKLDKFLINLGDFHLFPKLFLIWLGLALILFL